MKPRRSTSAINCTHSFGTPEFKSESLHIFAVKYIFVEQMPVLQMLVLVQTAGNVLVSHRNNQLTQPDLHSQDYTYIQA